MNKSAIFKAAHALTKSTIKTGDSYQVTFGAALRIVIAESKAPISIADLLLAAGCKVSEKGTAKRIYLNKTDVLACLGLKITEGHGVYKNEVRSINTKSYYCMNAQCFFADSGVLNTTLNLNGFKSGRV